jgi:hypothetical protein
LTSSQEARSYKKPTELFSKGLCCKFLSEPEPKHRLVELVDAPFRHNVTTNVWYVPVVNGRRVPS